MCIFQFFSIYDILKQSLEYTNILELQTKLCDILSPSIVDLCEIEIMAVRSSWLNSAASEKILNMNTGFYRFFFLLTYTMSSCLSAFGFRLSFFIDISMCHYFCWCIICTLPFLITMARWTWIFHNMSKILQ